MSKSSSTSNNFSGSAATTQCPMRTSSTPLGPAQCPIKADASDINPLNKMPNLPQSRVPHQTMDLPTNRTTSSIPRAENAVYVTALGPQESSQDQPSKWEYPSPQQFYNALVRKGWNTPEQHVEAMVLIHNRLNEDAWVEVLKWEARFGGGQEEAQNLELAEFSGIHGHLSHKAWVYQRLRRYLPSRFPFTTPFDRHDWIVRRPRSGKRIRYVIDYYSSRKSEMHEPDFLLDVRPASDSVVNVITKCQYYLEKAVLPSSKQSGILLENVVVYVSCYLAVLVVVGIGMKL